MAQVRDYKKLAADIKDAVGEENIVSATHCATRLRLVLKQSPEQAVTDRISQMPAVIQVVEKGGQYQIVIGTHAKDVYQALTEIMTIDENAQTAVKQGIGERIIATMSAVFAPFVYILAAAGLIQGLLIIINLFAPAFAKTGTYEVLSFLSWTPFTFLPVLIAITAAHHFKCNVYVAVWCCLALCNGSWADIASRIAGGEVVRFLGIPMSQTTYTSTVLPPLILVWVLSLLEKRVEKLIPDVFRAIFVPLICAVIMVPLTILVLGPISAAAANAVAAGLAWSTANIPQIAAIIIGGFWQVLVIFGVHWSVTPVIMADFAQNGQDAFQAFQTCAVFAQAAACLGVIIKTKSEKTRNVAVSAGLTGIFGITEPAIYGVNLPLKKPFICGCIGGAAGALVASLFGATYYVYAGLPGLLTIVNAIGPNKMAFVGELIGMAVTLVVTVVLIQIIGCDPSEAPAQESEGIEDRAASGAAPAEVEIVSPLNGTVEELASVNDPTFAEGLLGQGLAIVPDEGKLYSPVDGTVSMVFDTKHAVSLISDNGVEMLMHIGLDTVSLKGQYFDAKVKAGQHVKKGDLLIEFDIDEIRKKYDTVTPVLITNIDECKGFTPVHDLGRIRAGEVLMKATH